MAFTKAVKTQSKLRMALSGPSGSGKTYTALKLAFGIANGGTVAVIDTERGSASKYADIFPEFDVLELETFHPQQYIDAIRDAVLSGYSVIVIDSLTHAWNGTGGILELVESATKRQRTPNSYTAWADVTPIQNRFIDALTGSNIHIIATMRSKQEYSQEKDGNGKTVIKKLGLAPVQRDGMEYEFDVFADMDSDNTMIVQKSRCPELSGGIFQKPNGDVSSILSAWLQGEKVPELTESQKLAKKCGITEAQVEELISLFLLMEKTNYLNAKIWTLVNKENFTDVRKKLEEQAEAYLAEPGTEEVQAEQPALVA